MELAPLLVLIGAFAVLTGALARLKRRRVWRWVLLGALLPAVAVLAVLLLPRRRRAAPGGGGLPGGVDPDSWLRSLAAGATVRQQRDQVVAEAQRDAFQNWRYRW
ncbi:MAG: hypothetical protein F4Z25_11240 [Chloroflexi bacterium]|nr:hypothetical protein [Chloroflexota bacterium]MYE47165.1 hypothetical protein [Chloroflexota bacterium]